MDKRKIMREILFRAKRKDNDEWVSGVFIPDALETVREKRMLKGFILNYDEDGEELMYTVDRKSVGQYTGLTDRNGTKIFEGDIIVWDYDEVDFDGSTHSTPELVRWGRDYCGFIVNDDDEETVDENCRVIGNVYDNPELLKGEEK